LWPKAAAPVAGREHFLTLSMSEPKNIAGYLMTVAIVQCVVIFAFNYVLTKRLMTIANNLRDSLYRGNVSSEHVDNVNQAFASISSDLLWAFMVGIVLTAIGFGVLSRTIKYASQKNSRKTLKDN